VNADVVGQDASSARFAGLVTQLCDALDMPDVDSVLEARRLEIEGFSVVVDHVENDPDTLYLQLDYGVATAGRTLAVFRLMLESNLLVYAQDQAQLGLDPDTGSAQLIVRVPMSDEIDGAWLAETLVHYAEHGRYWRNHLLQAPDDMFEAISRGDYLWLKG
jgi:hypothetical protein